MNLVILVNMVILVNPLILVNLVKLVILVNQLKELKSEEMDANVGGSIHQAPVLVPLLGRLLGDLRVLNHLVVVVHLTGDAHGLG